MTTTMSVIAQDHQGFIAGLQELYTLLESMHYISPSDVVRPPHAADVIKSSTFEKLGYAPETISLMREIPAPRNEIVWRYQTGGTELIPRSKIVNYFLEEEHSDWLQYLRWGDRHIMEDEEGNVLHKLLPPWMLRLTIGRMYSWQHGVDLIYDLKNKTIIEWTSLDNKSWDESPSLPAETVLGTIVSKYRSLTWIPFMSMTWDFDKSRVIIENPISFQNVMTPGSLLPPDPEEAIKELVFESGDRNLFVVSLKEDTNRWRAFQGLYVDCGWGTDGYDSDEFERRRGNWWREYAEIKSQVRLESHELSALEKREAEIAERTARFWFEKAGKKAV